MQKNTTRLIYLQQKVLNHWAQFIQ